MKLFEQIYQKSLKEGRVKDMLFDYIEQHCGDLANQAVVDGMDPMEAEDLLEAGEFGELALACGYTDEFHWASEKCMSE